MLDVVSKPLMSVDGVRNMVIMAALMNTMTCVTCMAFKYGAGDSK